MAILGALLMVAGGAIVLASAILWILVYFPAEAIGRARSGLGSAAGGPKSVMLPAPK
jgi:hypothetical protein